MHANRIERYLAATRRTRMASYWEGRDDERRSQGNAYAKGVLDTLFALLALLALDWLLKNL